MTYILDRYIAGVVLTNTLMALLVVVALDTFFSFVGEVGDMGKGNYGALQALQYIGLTIPRRVHELFPMAALIGSLMGLGTLASHSELVAMRAAGFSVQRVIRSVLQIGLVMLLATTAIGEFVAPVAEQQGQVLREMARTERISFQSQHGYWARDGDTFIHIRNMSAPGRLRDIAIFQINDAHRMERATRVQQARHDGREWQLHEVRQSMILKDEVQTRHQETLQWDTLLAPDILDVVVLEPESMSARDLYQYVDYLDSNGLESDRYRLALWIRITAPLAGLVMLFLAVPFVFGSLRAAGTGQRLLVGVMVGLIFQLFSQMLSHLGQVYGMNPVLSAFAPIVVFFSIGLAAMRRV